MSKMIFALLVIVLSGCVSATYEPPLQSELKSDIIINKPFDEVWGMLIDYSASTFFGIENFEKESGLLTLSFGAANPDEFITGGHWETSVSGVSKKNSNHFEGDYVKYLSRNLGGVLTGKMNIVLRRIDESSTRVAINARYVFSATGGNTWVFNTGGCSEIAINNATSGTQKTRTICSTNKAEGTIINALELYARK